MSFTPHTDSQIEAMLKTLGIQRIDQLFDEIPSSIPSAHLKNIPESLSEAEMTRFMQDRAPSLKPGSCFIGAGAYEHYIPAAVWDLVSRGEFLTAYTPYQAEASQGTLQVIYEYQTMMANLTGMEVSNASLYDGATALTEAVLMALRLKKSQQKRIIVPHSVNPVYREVLKTVLQHQDAQLEEINLAEKNFSSSHPENNLAAVIIPQPNFFGNLEEVDAITNWAQAQGALVIAVVNPMAMALLKEPGSWGKQGADIVCGEGQPLGVPLSAGGPYFGFMCCKKSLVRQLPGRIVGMSVDEQGRRGFTLTLQAREQHIRRAKATSNICTNQGLLVTAATIYMTLMGAQGLRKIAMHCHAKAKALYDQLLTIKGVEKVFEQPFFHEFVIRVPNSALFLEQMASQGFQAGFDVSEYYPELNNGVLICATETKTEEDLINYCAAAKATLN